MRKRKRSQKKQKTSQKINKQTLQELISIGLFMIAVYSWIAIYYPDTTGIIGKWILSDTVLQSFGNSIKIFPIFLLITSIAILIGRTQAVIVVCFSLTSFLAFNMLSALDPYRYDPIFMGGRVGRLLLTTLTGLIGEFGVKLVIIGLFISTPLIIFNISIKSIVNVLRKKHNQVHKSNELNTKQVKPRLSILQFILQPILYGLFYYKKQTVIKRRTQVEKMAREKKESEKKESEKNQNEFLNEFEMSKFNIKGVEEEQSQSPEQKELPKIEYPNLKQIEKKEHEVISSVNYKCPPLNLLDKTKKIIIKSDTKKLQLNAKLLEETLISFNVKAEVVNITPGPSVTRYELKPGLGVKISKITALSKDIALKLMASDVRIEAPIPGKGLVGIEVPNKEAELINMRTIIDRTDFFNPKEKLVSALGLTITGSPVLMDLSKMPHVLIAGATGSGKSVCLNTIILSTLLKATPDEVRMLMIDPKKVELSLYDGIPHLIAPVVTNPHKAAATLKKWALIEMERRYEKFSVAGVKEINGYNKGLEEIQKVLKSDPEKAKKHIKTFFGLSEDEEFSESTITSKIKKLPYIMVIIDELADLMMVASQDVENTICRLAQMARATGIHLVIATQRPSVNVVTGLIKANIPSRISFYLQSQIDSRTILDMGGAEKLLGKGDMLYMPVGAFKVQRLQGVYVGEKEIKGIVANIKKQAIPNYIEEVVEIEPLKEDEKPKTPSSSENSDDLFEEAKQLVLNTQYASTSYLQRKLRIGYNRAARLMDELTEKGVISEYAGEKKSRAVISQQPEP